MKVATIAGLTLTAGLVGCGQVLQGLTPMPDEYEAVEIGMTEAEAKEAAYNLLLTTIKQAPTNIPDNAVVYSTRLNLEMTIGAEENADADGVPVVYEILLAFETDNSGERVLTAKRIGSDTVSIGGPAEIGNLGCAPQDSFLCEGEFMDWKDY